LLSIVIVQHMPPLFTQFLADRLSTKSQIKVVEAQEHMLLIPGTAYIAPGDHHMRFEKSDGEVRIVLDHGTPENSCRLAVDVMLRSVAEVFQGDVLVAILTGMGQDGKLGVELIKSRGGFVIAQDCESSVVWGMPGGAVEAGLADMVTSLSSVGPSILSQAGKA
jgi:two-component system, chemotaxis family, protein-glutamate methylesterase/glutaminase